ncbi:arginine-tRNA-protein transferase [Xylariomycetidae sp. FL2044]|nr:arginine-tRNA-protein transferase [Xylariomycetidae sp. FL2044]
MQTTPDAALEYISPIGYRKSTSCGYCRRRSRETGLSYYARATSISPAYYQSLLDRCWRRSGTLLYRPNQKQACCPHYTLRLDSNRIRATKDQRQAINRFNKHVIGEAYAKEAARLYPKSREQARKRDTEFDLVDRIHECESQSLTQPPEPEHAFTVTLEPATFTEEKYVVFENYQRIVHQEDRSDITRQGFKRFLCESPLKAEKLRLPDGSVRQLGSFHQCYRLDGKLVAIGVLDLLPDCVSAVYFLYHESIHPWSPGKLGALQEIALAKEKGYRWWYSGFYIHTCPKMKYKMDFSPQQILNPDTLDWVDVTKDVLAKFNSHGYLELTTTDPSGTATSTESEEDTQEEDMSDPFEELSLFRSNMPGIPSIEELASFDLDHIPARVSNGYAYVSDLFQWAGERTESITQIGSVKSQIAELVAAVGPDLMERTCLDFRRSSSHESE